AQVPEPVPVGDRRRVPGPDGDRADVPDAHGQSADHGRDLRQRGRRNGLVEPTRPVADTERVKNLLLGLLVMLGFLVLFELGARVFNSIYVDVHNIRAESKTDDREWSVLSPDLGWSLRPGFHGDVGGYPRAFDADGHLAVDSKQIAEKSMHRVLFIGDSNTFGVGTPTDHTFAEVTERLSPGLVSINLGVPGYASFQGRRVLDRA